MESLDMRLSRIHSTNLTLKFSFVADLTAKLASNTLISILRDEMGMKLGQIYSGHVFIVYG